MTLTRLETERIARSTNALRPDWPINSIETFIWQNLKHHAYRDVALVLNIVATDPLTQTPKRVLEAGPWWQATQYLGGAASATKPRSPQCQIHHDCLQHPDHPIGADRCPDCKQTLVTDAAEAKQLAQAVKDANREARTAAPTVLHTEPVPAIDEESRARAAAALAELEEATTHG